MGKRKDKKGKLNYKRQVIKVLMSIYVASAIKELISLITGNRERISMIIIAWVISMAIYYRIDKDFPDNKKSKEVKNIKW